ncbi:MAG: universal stress protein, partial [Solirubrobacteraceae bacterium]
MPTRTIISYDDTVNDRDALMLGRVLSEAGSELTLVYVRHTTQTEHDREQLEEHGSQELLERGGQLLGDLGVDRRVVVSPSTADGLKMLAEQEHADVIVFGSDYRTAARHVAPQHSTQALLEGSPA